MGIRVVEYRKGALSERGAPFSCSQGPELRPGTPPQEFYSVTMHPLVAVGLVILAALAWTGTVVTLLVAFAKVRSAKKSRAPDVESRKSDVAEART